MNAAGGELVSRTMYSAQALKTACMFFEWASVPGIFAAIASAQFINFFSSRTATCSGSSPPCASAPTPASISSIFLGR